MELFDAPDMSHVRRLLEAAGLPVEDLPEPEASTGAVHGDGLLLFGLGGPSLLKGVVGLEVYGTCALLRSLAVDPDARGAGLGSILVAHVEREAVRRGVDDIYLLTLTAESFFAARGYEVIPRDQAPDPIRNTTEFSGLCPDSAAFMVKRSPEA